MLPTPEARRYARRMALIQSSLLGVTGIVVSSLLWLLHPAACLAVAALSLIAAWLAYYLGMRTILRRERILRADLPDGIEQVLRERVEFYRNLEPAGQERFRRNVQIFLGEKEIVGAGVEIDDTIRALVAASAVIPIFGFPGWEYGMLQLVVVRPEPFEAHFRSAPDDVDDPLYACGMVGEGGIFSGTLVLSKTDLLRDYRLAHDGHNVGIHEFAHLIDQAGGQIDGMPVSLPGESRKPWAHMVHRILSEGRRGLNADIPDYGFTNEQEFFAVISEYFFEKPHELQRRHPELFALLEQVFRQQPQRIIK